MLVASAALQRLVRIRSACGETDPCRFQCILLLHCSLLWGPALGTGSSCDHHIGRPLSRDTCRSMGQAWPYLLRVDHWPCPKSHPVVPLCHGLLPGHHGVILTGQNLILVSVWLHLVHSWSHIVCAWLVARKVPIAAHTPSSRNRRHSGSSRGGHEAGALGHDAVSWNWVG